MYNTFTSLSSNAVGGLPTTPRPASPSGVTSRNLFSSPNSARKLPLEEKAFPLALTGPRASLNPITAMPMTRCSQFQARVFLAYFTPIAQQVQLIVGLYSNSRDRDSIAQLLEDQLPPSSRNTARERKAPSPPEPIRAKRSIAGKRRHGCMTRS